MNLTLEAVQEIIGRIILNYETQLSAMQAEIKRLNELQNDKPTQEESR